MSEKKEFEKLSKKELKEKYEKPIDRIKHMSNGQIVVRTFLLFAIMSIVSVGLYLVLEGIPVAGIPGKNKLVKAEIMAPRLTEEVVVVTDKEFLEYSRNIVSYLGTATREIEGEIGEPFVTIRYTDKKGNTYEVAANENVLFYEGETKRLKKTGMFVVIAEGLFFPELTQYVITE